jgi:glutathione peroxidase-family protein
MGNGAATKKCIFDFDVPDKEGNPTSMSQFKGKKAFLIVNVASL